MNKILIVLLTLLFNIQQANAFNIDTFMDKNVAPVSDAIAAVIFHPIHVFGADVPIIIFWILFAGIFFTFYLRGIAVWGFKHAIEVVCKPKKSAGDGSGETSAFQALMTALSGTIGLGSIAGVAIAISMGGPGAAFWIIVGALLGMSLKFVEASLAVKYRRFNLDGSISGGPMHYMAHGLTRKKMRWLGQPLSVMFAILCICGGITGGNMIQINQAANQFVNVCGGENGFMHNFHWVIGLGMAIVVGLIVIGGIKNIVKVTEKIVPLKIFIYLFAAMAVIICNIKLVPHAAWIIVKEAFKPESIYGGMFVAMIMGLRRSVQSNEAGTGSAPIVYATVKTDEPLSQGFVALLDPFLTGFMCTLTAFAIVKSALLGLSFGDGPLFSSIITTNIMVGITGSSSAGLMITVGTFGQEWLTWAQQIGMSPEVLHRIICIASEGFDTVPHAGALVTLMAVCGLTHKESYYDIFVLTLLKFSVAFICLSLSDNARQPVCRMMEPLMPNSTS